MFGAAAIDEDAHEAFLEMLDEEEGDDILLAPAARPAHQQGACVCVCVCVRARAFVCVCVCACVRFRVLVHQHAKTRCTSLCSGQAFTQTSWSWPT